MEYAGSYALYNYRLLNESRGMEYDNLSLIRAFENGLDNQSSEAGFVLVHVAMARYSHGLVAGVKQSLAALSKQDAAEPDTRCVFEDGLQTLLSTLRQVNLTMES